MTEDDIYNKGLPPLWRSGKAYSFFEFWPAWLFYIPVVFYWLWLAAKYRNLTLPLLVNPSIYLSGMVGESKGGILDQLADGAREHMLPYVCFDRGTDLDSECDRVESWLQRQKLNYPCVLKPDLGCRGAGVNKINDGKALRSYLTEFGKGRRYIVQALAPFIAEAGVFYERAPGAERGSISSLTLKYLPYVVGDGKRSIRQLILSDPRGAKLKSFYFEYMHARLNDILLEGECLPLVFSGSHCRGAIFRDGNHLITDTMVDALERCLSGMSDFHYGRFDIKFRSIESLQQGKDFYILELNGASSEATHIWDAHGRLLDVFVTLFRQYRTLFKFGASMQQRKLNSWSVSDVIVHWWRGLKSSKTNPKSF